jgi:hypothetical protein
MKVSQMSTLTNGLADLDIRDVLIGPIASREHFPEGFSRVQIRALFNRHVSKERIDLALEQLMTLGLIHHETSGKRGRPATLWAKVEDPKVAGPETYGA